MQKGKREKHGELSQALQAAGRQCWHDVAVTQPCVPLPVAAASSTLSCSFRDAVCNVHAKSSRILISSACVWMYPALLKSQCLHRAEFSAVVPKKRSLDNGPQTPRNPTRREHELCTALPGGQQCFLWAINGSRMGSITSGIAQAVGTRLFPALSTTFPYMYTQFGMPPPQRAALQSGGTKPAFL